MMTEQQQTPETQMSPQDELSSKVFEGGEHVPVLAGPLQFGAPWQVPLPAAEAKAEQLHIVQNTLEQAMQVQEPETPQTFAPSQVQMPSQRVPQAPATLACSEQVYPTPAPELIELPQPPYAGQNAQHIPLQPLPQQAAFLQQPEQQPLQQVFPQAQPASTQQQPAYQQPSQPLPHVSQYQPQPQHYQYVPPLAPHMQPNQYPAHPPQWYQTGSWLPFENNYVVFLVLAILEIIFCGWFCAIPALVFAALMDAAYKAGNGALYKRHKRAALIWLIVSACVGAIAFLLYLFVLPNIQYTPGGFSDFNDYY